MDLPSGLFPSGFYCLLQIIFTDYLLQQLYTSSSMTSPPSKPTTKSFRALRSVSTRSTLSRVHQWGGSYLTYCRPKRDGDDSSQLLSIRLVDEENYSLTSVRHNLPPVRASHSPTRYFPVFLRDNLAAPAFLFPSRSNACYDHYVGSLLTSVFKLSLSYLQAGNTYSAELSGWR